MADYDEDFEQAGSGASTTFPKQCSALRKNENVMLKGHACKIVEMSTSKTGKHGHAKVHLVGLDIFDGKKYEDICPSTHNMDVPHVKRHELSLCDIDDEGYLTLMDDKGHSREDLKTKTPALRDEIQRLFDEGNDLMITILKALDREEVISVKKASSK